ncbi:hypothetical protein [Petrimonas sulfuriphila]|uniref:hypothetical protein n=1 Tax=Petrimonas sulfuriphila TaxID=285070 RepID=UPI003EBB7750
MKPKEEAPGRSGEPMQGQNFSLSVCEQGKDIKQLSKRQKKVFDLLCTGKHSVTDITIALGYGDPRSYIRDIREKGIVVNDRWKENGDVRYKVYWIDRVTPVPLTNENIQTVGDVIQRDFKNLFERNRYDR